VTSEIDQYARAHRILGGARELTGASLDAYLADACGEDTALRVRILELLAAGYDDEANDPFSDERVKGARLALEGVVASATSTWLPERIGEYRIVRQIGQGGMGVVYEARQESPRRRVAIKLLHPMHATPDRIRRFRQEAQLLGRLQHPGIAAIFEAGTYDVGRGPQPFFAMELVDGSDIRTHCDRHDLDHSTRVELLARVADAVHYAHEHGVVHRDLKPDNVLVTRNGRPRILDFGIARATSGSATLSTIVTEEGQLVGTLAYMAPEQLNQSTDAITPQIDVYALGVLGFEILAGRLPRDIQDLSVSQAVALLATSDSPRASMVDTSLKGDVETILGTALEFDRERRYASAAALAGDLRRHLAHQPIQARPPSRIYLARKFTRRHRGLVGGVVATLIVAIVGAFVASGYAVDATQRANELERANYRFGVAAANSAVQQEDYRTAAAHLDGAPAVHRGWEHDYLRARLTQHVDEWDGLQGRMFAAPVFGPEGRRMFALVSGTSIGVWDVSSGRRLRTHEVRGATAGHPLESAGGKLHGPTLRYAMGTTAGDLLIGDLESGERQHVLRARSDQVPKVLAWDQAGRRLLYWSDEVRIWDGTHSRVLADGASNSGAFNRAGDRIAISVGGRVTLYDAATGSVLVQQEVDDHIVDLAFSPDDETLAAASHYRNVHLFDGRTLEVRHRLTGHQDTVHSVRWDSSGSRLITASEDGTTRIWDAESLESSVGCVTDCKGLMTAVVLPDGEHAVVVGERVRKFSLGDPSVLRGHASFVYLLAFSPDGSMLASSGYQDPDVYVWQVDLGRPKWCFRSP